MNYLSEMVAVLKPSETRLVEKALRTQSQNSRRWDLFKRISTGDYRSDEEVAQALYGKEPSSAFSHLKTRLYNNILEIIFPNHLPEPEDSAEQLRYECLRKILLAQFFVSREAYQNGFHTLAEAKALATQGGLLPERIMAEDMMLRMKSLLQADDEDPPVSQDVEALKLQLDAKQETLRLERLMERENPLPENLPAHVPALAARFAEALSLPPGKTTFWQLRFLIHYHLACHQIPQAAQMAKRLQQLIQELDADIDQAERPQAFLLLSRVSFAAGNESGARHWLSQVFATANPASLNWLQALEQLFLLDSYARDYPAATHSLHQAMAHPKLGLSTFKACKWRYYQACMAYVSGNWHQSLQLILENKELFKYKSKWLLGLKVLEMYNFIALGKHDLVEYKLNALKQLLKRQKNHDVGRCKFLCKMIGIYLRTGCDKDATRGKLPHDSKYLWSPFSYEVVCLDTWLLSDHERPQVQA